MRVGIFFTFIFLLVNTASSLECRDLLSTSREASLFKYTQEDTHNKVEVLRVENSMGPQQMGSITFQTWFDLSYEFNLTGDDLSIVGLTKNGSVFHLIKVNGRTLAKRLNGDRVFKDINVTSFGKIIAINSKDQTEVFAPALWLRPAKEVAKKRWVDLFALSSFVAIGGAQFFPHLDMPMEMTIPLVNLTLFSFNFPLYELMLTGAGALSASFAVLSKYHHLNTYPDGFVKVDVDFDDPNWFERVEFKSNVLENFDPSLTELEDQLDDRHGTGIE